MFGVLVCQNHEGKLGYLWAFSGKLAGVNHHPYFVPTIFDMLHEDGFFRKEEEVLNAINQIEILENSDDLLNAKKIRKHQKEAVTDIQNQKDKIKRLKLNAMKSVIHLLIYLHLKLNN